jgi:L-threonylcarbamoyladenylate synthase
MNEIDQAVKILQSQDVVGMPTETVYGLAGIFDSDKAVNKIFSVKERPFFDPLIIHVSSISMAKELTTNWNSICDALAKKFWPGALTLVLPKAKNVSNLITSGLDSVGIRLPNHPRAIELIKAIDKPLAAPSANKFTKTSPTSKEHVNSEFGEDVFVIDGGQCEVGIESTVAGIFENEVKIYRPGMIGIKQIQEALINAGIKDIAVSVQESPVAPGAMKHHYMPNKPVSLYKEIQKNSSEASSWIVPDNPQVAARELYSKLRELDKSQSPEIHIILDENFKSLESYQGILNRLNKAKTHDFYFC